MFITSKQNVSNAKYSCKMYDCSSHDVKKNVLYCIQNILTQTLDIF